MVIIIIGFDSIGINNKEQMIVIRKFTHKKINIYI